MTRAAPSPPVRWLFLRLHSASWTYQPMLRPRQRPAHRRSLGPRPRMRQQQLMANLAPTVVTLARATGVALATLARATGVALATLARATALATLARATALATLASVEFSVFAGPRVYRPK